MKKVRGLLFTIGICLLSQASIAQWVQKGIDLDGEYTGDQSGTSVDMSDDGSTIIIGAISNDANGNAGHARVYNWSGSAWVQLGQDIDGENPNDWCGQSVAMSADGLTVAVGAHRNAGNGANSGHVRVFKLVSGSWVQQGADIDGEATNDYSGTSVDLNGDGLTVVVGARGNDGNGSNSGHARVFKLTSGVWVQQGADIDGEAPDDNSGIVSISNDGLTVAVGAYLNDGNGTSSGHVRVYKLISGSWVQQGADIDGEGMGDNSGKSVSLSSDGLTLAIGAPENNGGPISNAGHARVYKFIAGNWIQQGGDIDGEASSDDFGESVSISSDGLSLVVGGFRNDATIPGNDVGHVRVFKLVSGSWVQQGADIDGEAANDWFGKAVSMNASGTSVLIGAIFNDGTGLEAGHSRVYSNCTNTNGTDVQTACGSYTWIDNNNYTSSNNTATHTLVGGNANGCDSIVTLNLTINNATAGTDVQVACSSYVWIDNNTYTSNNTTATHTIVNGAANGCDSVVTLNLTINNATAGTDVQTACNSYTWMDNNTYTASNTTATHTLVNGNVNGCDSVVTLNLTINNADTSVTKASPMLTANASGAIYRWLDCNNAYAVIAGATNQNFTPAVNGSYAVEVTENGCTDTSSCYTIIGIGIRENNLSNSVSLYPNPTSGVINIALGNHYNDINIQLKDVTGKLIDQKNYQGTDRIEYNLKRESGIYFIELTSEKGERNTLKIIKQ